MINLPEHIKLKFFETIFGNVNLKDFENWIYNDKEIETILSSENYLELISFNYKKNGAKYELVKLLADKYIDLGEYEKWKMLNLLIKAREKDESLPYILRNLYDLYCKGYAFLYDLGLGYGLAIEVPPSKYAAETWEAMNETDKKELIDSFYPQLKSDIERAIDWIENKKIIFTGKTDEIGHYQYNDLRTDKEKQSTVWTEVQRDEKTGFKAFKSNLKIQNEEDKEGPTTIDRFGSWFKKSWRHKFRNPDSLN